MEGHAALHLEPRPRLGALQQKLASACGFRSGVSTSCLAPSREPALRSAPVSCPEQTADPRRPGPGQPGCGCRGRPGRGPSGALGHRGLVPAALPSHAAVPKLPQNLLDAVAPALFVVLPAPTPPGLPSLLVVGCHSRRKQGSCVGRSLKLVTYKLQTGQDRPWAPEISSFG